MIYLLKQICVIEVKLKKAIAQNILQSNIGFTIHDRPDEVNPESVKSKSLMLLL